MIYINRDIIALVYLFIKKDHTHRYTGNDKIPNATMIGTVIQTRNTQKRKYTWKICWHSSTKPVGFNMDHAEVEFKTSPEFREKLSKARMKFIEKKKR